MTRGRWIAVIAVEVLGLCCCGGFIALIFAGTFEADAPPPTAVALARPTLTAAPAETRSRTNTAATQTRTTLTLQTATRSSDSTSNLYNVVIPTPTAARILYPVDFVDTFALVTYPVNGATLSTISRSLDANAMADPHEPGSKYYARTDWYISYRITSKTTTRGCELDKSSVTIHLTMTLPALATTNVPNDVSDRWSTFIQKAIVHESGHVKLAQDGARAFQRDLGNFSSAPTCDTLETRVKGLFDKSFTAIDKSNVQYDVDTRHGITQGAVFP